MITREPLHPAYRDELLAPEQLSLDPHNPRLVGQVDGDDQKSLLRALWQYGALDELALSLAENGYFDSEPLIAVRERRGVVVVEGNRRLATVKLLLDPQARDELRATDLPRLTGKARQTLERLPVRIYDDRRHLWAYVGFRHVNGPRVWDSWSKAQYIARVHNEYGITLDEIAARIGDKHQTVLRLYRGLMVLQQAQEERVFEPADRYRPRFAFSHLYTGLDYAGFRDHLGLPKDGSVSVRPVPRKNVRQLGELMTWLFGSKSKSREPVITTQNPDLRKLDDVLKDERALTALRGQLGLDVAHRLTKGEAAALKEALTRAKVDLQEARGLLLDGFHGEPDTMDLVDSIARLAQHLKADADKLAEEAETGAARHRARRA
jgi:hypothetical protein